MIPFFKLNAHWQYQIKVFTFGKEYIFKWSFLQNTLDCRQSQGIQSLRINWKCRQSSHWQKFQIQLWGKNHSSLHGQEGNETRNIWKKYYLVRGYVGAKRNSFELFSFSLFTPWKSQHNHIRTCTTGTKITNLVHYSSL